MSNRLQVVVDETELRRYQQAARAVGLTLSEWVRQVLRTAESDVAHGDPDRKLAVVRAAARHQFPAPDIDVMLGEIEQGYRVSTQP